MMAADFTAVRRFEPQGQFLEKYGDDGGGLVDLIGRRESVLPWESSLRSGPAPVAQTTPPAIAGCHAPGACSGPYFSVVVYDQCQTQITSTAMTDFIDDGRFFYSLNVSQ